MKTADQRSHDPATTHMLNHLAGQDVQLAWDRSDAMEPRCGFGLLGICCRNCTMGPCRIDPFGDGPSEGVCGATADIMPTEPIADKWTAFGWHVQEIHGHNVREILEALNRADEVHAVPSVIIARRDCLEARKKGR